MPAPVISVPRFHQSWIAWMALVFCVLVRRDQRHNQALIEHERVHLRQQWRYLLVGFLVLYFGSRRWRVRFEAEAYATSVRYGASLDRCAELLAGRYGVTLTHQQARDAIRQWLPGGSP